MAAGVHPAIIQIQKFDSPAELGDYLETLGSDPVRYNKFMQYRKVYAANPSLLYPAKREKLDPMLRTSETAICTKLLNARRAGAPKQVKKASAWGCTGVWSETLGKHFNKPKWAQLQRGSTTDTPMQQHQTRSTGKPDKPGKTRTAKKSR